MKVEQKNETVTFKKKSRKKKEVKSETIAKVEDLEKKEGDA